MSSIYRDYLDHSENVKTNVVLKSILRSKTKFCTTILGPVVFFVICNTFENWEGQVYRLKLIEF
jgi:hypothetical protein